MASMPLPCRPAALCFLVVLLAGPPGHAEPLPAILANTPLQPAGDATVRRVGSDGDLQLTDGRQAVLAGIALPRRPLTLPAGAPWPIGDTATAAISALTGSAPLHLYRAERAEDRYGRLLVHAVTADGRWLQGALLRQGLARVATTPDSRAAALPMLAIEAEARQAGRGLWAISAFAVHQSGDAPALMDSVQVVEGVVGSARLVKGNLYLHLGKDWRQNLTVRIPRAVLAQCEDVPPLATLIGKPEGWHGRRIRVRGWIERAKGPSIEVSHPEQIEMLDAGTANGEGR